MNIFQKIAFINKVTKAYKKSTFLINSKRDLAEKVRKHLDTINVEIQELLRLLPDFKSVYNEAISILEEIK